MNASRRRWIGGFTLIELVITVAIVGLVATVVFPMAELAVQRSKERDLRDALRQIRGALDAYKQAVIDKHIIPGLAGDTMGKAPSQANYPPTLQVLVDGVDDALSPNKSKIYFLRRLPRDPMADDPNLADDATWGKRSYASPPEEPAEGDDVFDVYSLSTGTCMNGIPYRKW
jgi:general secretion pathway protein G